ncbi:uncharacterized protein LOC111612685 [Centruroides sculpturatus]|uniref:uncharacterized protein LOC111612685 n=1 Tax=Centruroides sculpturatus TaxID=218467 RepID=UPI000C6DC0E9|nr:uncharacterized protein LOC111612685 [Centruroides sculpturatus]
MFKALSLVTKNLRRFKGNIDFFTDSRYVLNVIKGTKKLTATGIKLHNLAKNLDSYRNISFKWVPGHSNIEGNEKADKLAKKAAELMTNPSFGLIPISYINQHIHDNSIKLWEEEWNNSETGRTTFSFLPSIRKRQKYNYITPSFFMTQCLTGHGNIPTYLHRIGRRNTDVCTCDNQSVGDILHILFDCPRYEANRRDLKTYCITHGQSWPPRLDYLCAYKGSFEHLQKLVNNCNAFQNDFSGHRAHCDSSN